MQVKTFVALLCLIGLAGVYTATIDGDPLEVVLWFGLAGSLFGLVFVFLTSNEDLFSNQENKIKKLKRPMR